MSVPHESIMLTIIPDDYHISFAGKTDDGHQVFVTADFVFDHDKRVTTDYICTYWWNHKGDFQRADIHRVGVRGQYSMEGAAKAQDVIQNAIQGFAMDEIHVKPFKVKNDGHEFGFIPSTVDGFTVVEMMPGNCICFTEPFDGEYDT